MFLSTIRYVIMAWSLCILALSAQARTVLDCPDVGRRLDDAYSHDGVVTHKEYPDLAVPARAEGNALVYRLVAEQGKNITALTFTTEIQCSVEKIPHIQVSVSKNRQGPWTPLYIQRISKQYAFETHVEEIRGLGAPVYYVRIAFADCWTDGGGHSDIQLRKVRADIQEAAGSDLQLFFKDRRNVFTQDVDAVVECIPSGNLRSFTLVDHLRRKCGTFEFDPKKQEQINFGKLKPGFYHVLQNDASVADFCVVTSGIQARADHSVAQVDLGRNGVWPTGLTRAAAQLCQLAGVQYVRERWAYGWASMEPERGKYNLEYMKEFLAIEKEYGLKSTLIMSGMPGWAGAEYGEDLRDNYNTAAGLGDRLRGLTCSWEYWNEPDSWPFGVGPAHRYASSLKAASLGFRKMDPDASSYKVAFGGISAIARAPFVDDVLANQVADSIDIYNSHIYELTPDYPVMYGRHQELLRKYKMLNKEKWITEGGALDSVVDLAKRPVKWPMESQVPADALNTATCDVLDAARRDQVSGTLIKNWVISARHRWSRYFTFCFAYYNEGPKIWGILAPGLTATPSYAALATYNHLLGDLDYAGRMTLKGELEGHLYRGKSGTVAVIWATNEKQQTLELAGVQAAYAMTGEELSAAEMHRVGANPMFVRLAHYSGTLDAALPALKPAAPEKNVSPIVLDFVRTPVETKWRVNTNRQYVLDSLGQEITGNLYVYNFGATAWSGDLTFSVPAAWTLQLGQTAVEVPAMGRISVPVRMRSTTIYQDLVQRVTIRTDSDRSIVAMPFYYDRVLGSQRVVSLLARSAECAADAPSKVKLDQGKDLWRVAAEYAGEIPTVRVRVALPGGKNNGQGISFHLVREPNANQPHYIDVRVTNADGSVSRMDPNIFPVFLDGVSAETYVVRYNQLAPATDGCKAVKLEISFSSFAPQTCHFEIRDLQTWVGKTNGQ